MSTYKAAVLESAGHLVVKQVPHRALSYGEVLVRVSTCGVCYGDTVAYEAHVPNMSYPRVPGHEIVGVIEKIGEGVPDSRGFAVNQRVGRGWHGGHCFGCDQCLKGRFLECKNALVTGLSNDGGYAEYVYCPWQSLAVIPDGLSNANASALMCAGLTVFNGLRQLNLAPPAVVAVHGIGGLGHLAIQFASRMGYQVVAISSGAEKEGLAKELGATTYINTSTSDAAKDLKSLGGADVIIATTYSSEATSKLFDGLATRGTLLVVGADHQSLSVSPLQLIGCRGRIAGHASGHPAEAQDTLKFACQTGIDTKVEMFPLDKAQEAYNRMRKESPKFRVVIDCTGENV